LNQIQTKNTRKREQIQSKKKLKLGQIQTNYLSWGYYHWCT